MSKPTMYVLCLAPVYFILRFQLLQPSPVLTLDHPIAQDRCDAISNPRDDVTTSLARARALTPPHALKTEGGEHEGAEFWDRNSVLLKEAWAEYGQKHPSLYTFDADFEVSYDALHPNPNPNRNPRFNTSHQLCAKQLQ